MTPSDLLVPYHKLASTLQAVLLKFGFSIENALLSAQLFAKSSLDGVASHGLNRFPEYLRMIREGYILVDSSPELLFNLRNFECWDGKSGPGNLNAHFCMQRAIDISLNNGFSCVSLKHTNHWMRAGNYGWQAVDNECIGICFTNTKPNMPGWGGSQPIIGNNPLVIAIPRKEGAIVLDMAMSQFSYGKMQTYLNSGLKLPYDGGFDEEGKLSRNPKSIIETEMALAVGLWKGTGLSLILDILSSLLSTGLGTHEIGMNKEETKISQVFVAVHLPKLGISGNSEDKINAIIHNYQSSRTFDGVPLRYPGENTLAIRKKNSIQGVPVDAEIWERVQNEL